MSTKYPHIFNISTTFQHVYKIPTHWQKIYNIPNHHLGLHRALYTLLSGKHFQPNTILTSLGRVQPCYNYWKKTIHAQTSTTVHSQVLTQLSELEQRKVSKFVQSLTLQHMISTWVLSIKSDVLTTKPLRIKGKKAKVSNPWCFERETGKTCTFIDPVLMLLMSASMESCTVSLNRLFSGNTKCPMSHDEWSWDIPSTDVFGHVKLIAVTKHTA